MIYINFNKVKLSKIIIAYILLGTIILLIGSKISISQDKFLSEIILNVFLIFYIYRQLSKCNKDLKLELKEKIRSVDWRKILKLYLLNIPFFVFLVFILVFTSGKIQSSSGYQIFFGILVAPIVEEVVFRGVLFEKLRKKGLKKAIIISALIFTILHIDINFLTRVLFAITNTILYIQTENIVNPIIVHSLKNLTIFLIPIIFNNISGSLALTDDLIIICIIILIVLYVKVNFSFIKEAEEKIYSEENING